MTETRQDPGPETVYLGRYDPLKIPIILEVLAEHGIFALTKVAVDEAENEQYPFLGEGRGIVLVDRAKVDRARSLIETEVGRRLTEMSTVLGELGEKAEGIGVSFARNWISPRSSACSTPRRPSTSRASVKQSRRVSNTSG